MSTSKVISKDQAGTIERWQCPNVEQTKAADSGLSFNPVTAEAIEKIQKQAYKEAYDAGFAKGYTEGSAKGQSEYELHVGLMKKALRSLASPFAQLDKEVEKQLTQLAITISRQLVRREIKTDPGQVIAIVREAILALPSASKKVHIYLNPEDLELVKTKLSSSDGESYWQLIEDPILSRGDCIVMTDTSAIDATMERRLSSIVAEMLGGEREQDGE